jgi:hypothetical protein
MADNQKNHGIETDAPVGRRFKPRSKKKPYKIEARISLRVPNFFYSRLGMDDWWRHSSYRTRAQRDTALETLIKKGERETYHRMEYRAVGP